MAGPGAAGARAIRRIRSSASARQRPVDRAEAPPQPGATGGAVPADLLRALARRPLIQPDRTTCGSASLVVARMIADSGYRRQVLGGPGSDPAEVQARFAEAVLDEQRKTNRWRDADGRWQLRWPRGLGTTPTAAANLLNSCGGLLGAHYRVAVIDPAKPAAAYLGIADAAARGYPCLLFVGDRWCPRHVVLAVAAGPGGLTAYEPSSGLLQHLDPDVFASGRLALAGWKEPWLVVLPG